MNTNRVALDNRLRSQADPLSMDACSQQHRMNRGFTLIELVVVMLLISIVLSVALPRFNTGIGQDPTKRVSRWLFHTVRTLRSEAIQKQVAQTLVIDISNRRMWTVNPSMDEQAQSGAADKAFRLPGDVAIADILYANKDSVSAGTAEINFYPAGFSDFTVIRMQDDGDRFSYILQPLLPKVKFVEEWVSF